MRPGSFEVKLQSSNAIVLFTIRLTVVVDKESRKKLAETAVRILTWCTLWQFFPPDALYFREKVNLITGDKFVLPEY